ncbi:MAG: response regulator [Desulfobacteraceae bacterium]|nr:MAG: response regulator [Desulfobacteraceae bacterium]
MHSDVIILVAEDDDGHANLIRKNLKRAGIINEIILFKDGQEILDFLFKKGDGPKRASGCAYILLLDIRMPKVDGVQVLSQIKADPNLKKLPVIMITTTDDPREIVNCHEMGCSNYVTKPIDYENFVNAVRQLGLFLSVVQVPIINGE